MTSYYLRNPFRLWHLYQQSRTAFRFAVRSGGPGIRFGRFGKRLGWRMILNGRRAGVHYVLTPVDIVRYFEFSFAHDCLPSTPGRTLDISSPRLFSLFVARAYPAATLTISNPDAQDLAETRDAIRALKLRNIQLVHGSVASVASQSAAYDCIWSISVIEHISERYQDSDAIVWMYQALKPGGRLILTFPVDRAFRDEYRAVPSYDIKQNPDVSGSYFFQHVYDKTAIMRRLLEPLGRMPTIIRWFGETVRGRLCSFLERWQREGLACSVESPTEIVRYYQEYDSYESMPGMGICGMMIEKP